MNIGWTRITQWSCVSLLIGFVGFGAAASAIEGESPDQYSFVVIGHLRGEPDDGTYFLLGELLDRVQELSPDLIFLTGDMIFGDWHRPVADRERIVGEWEDLDAALATVDIPVFRVPGNHDINDPVTRDVYYSRYGEPPVAVEFGRDLFMLLASPHIPQGTDAPGLPRPYPRMTELASSQVEFIKEQLESGREFRNVFLFMHHILWWSQDSIWWQEVHPVLAKHGTRGVFAGDHGPLKFSHFRRDGIEYLHTALEGKVPARHLRLSEEGRLIHYQFDHFLYVAVEGEQVDVRVEVVGALSSGKHDPTFYEEVFAESPLTRRDRIRRALGGPKRRALLAGLLMFSFLTGGAVCWLVLRSQLGR